ncbi:hypothetical protein Tco_1298827, partial [Tanacetum coccineum]
MGSFAVGPLFVDSSSMSSRSKFLKEPEFKGYGPENSKKESNVVKESDNSKENSDKSLVKEQESQVSNDEEQDESMT